MTPHFIHGSISWKQQPKKCIHLYSAFGESRRMIQNYQKPLFTVIPEWWHSCLKWVNLSPRGYLIGYFFLRLLFCPMDNIVFAKSVCYCQALCCHMTRYVDTWYHAVNRMCLCAFVCVCTISICVSMLITKSSEIQMRQMRMTMELVRLWWCFKWMFPLQYPWYTPFHSYTNMYIDHNSFDWFGSSRD